ncbi:integrase, partial [Escherichia coli]|nr:integrase [Escherichia coli]EFN4083890.1 integrase [Escherichia coli]EFN5341207.1 integrase [Escherichia coli]
LDARMAPVVLSGAYLQRAGVFSLQQPMPPGIKPPQHCASPESFRLDADSTTVFLFRNPSHLHSVLRIPQNIIRLQPLHFSYEKGRRVSPLRPGPGANCHYGSLTPT